nr:hypothetical protein H10E21.2 - Caenorhabditis elegans [Caenorhabditis elegans]
MTTDIISVAQHVITTSYITVILFGNIGNVWVSWKVGIVFVFDKSSLVPRNIVMLILFICVADLLVLLHLTLFVHFQFEKQWIFGNIVFILLHRGGQQTHHPIGSSPYQQGVLRICSNDVTQMLQKEAEHMEYCISAVLCYGVDCSRSFDAMVFNILAFVFGYGFTSAAYMYFYLRVPMILKRRYSSIKTTSSNSTRFNHQSILKIRHTVNAFVVVYMACWTPYWALFWLFFTFPPSNNWMVIISQMAHLLPYISCAAYPIILTFINKGIRNAHSTIMTSQRKKLMTIRAGAYQVATPTKILFPDDNCTARVCANLAPRRQYSCSNTNQAAVELLRQCSAYRNPRGKCGGGRGDGAGGSANLLLCLTQKHIIIIINNINPIPHRPFLGSLPGFCLHNFVEVEQLEHQLVQIPNVENIDFSVILHKIIAGSLEKFDFRGDLGFGKILKIKISKKLTNILLSMSTMVPNLSAIFSSEFSR